MRARLLLAAIIVLGCAPDFDPMHLATGYRVLTIQAEPPEAVLDPAVLTGQAPPSALPVIELTAFEANAEGAEREWEVCLFSLERLAGFECLSPTLVAPLPGGEATTTLDVGAVLLEIFSRNAGQGPTDAGPPANAPAENDCALPFLALPDGSCLDRLDLQVKLTAGPPDGRTVTAIKKVRLYLDREVTLNTNPTVRALTIEGTPAPGATVTLRVDLDDSTLDRYVDVEGDTVTEVPVFNWYTTAGELTPGATFADDRDTRLKLPRQVEGGAIEVFVVARDGEARGGVGFARAMLTLP
ncbi:MAG: hypothetical protein KC620_08825 [Myxococcales bacterium]|nr:hypothetical protein [Myxococcales bacterium]